MIGFIIGVVVGFFVGLLVGRRNAQKVEKLSNEVDKVVSQVENKLK